MPTGAPSLTGSVATVELTRPVTESISDEEISNIQSEVANTYGVDAEDINVEVVYQTTGSIELDVSDTTLTDEELAEAFEEEIASLLGIHEGDVEVTITDGVATYTITSDSAENAEDLQNDISQSAEALTGAIEDSANVNVISIDVDDEVNAEVVVTVDTSGAENNLNDAAESLETSFEEQGYIAEAESNKISIIFVAKSLYWKNSIQFSKIPTHK